MIASNEVTLLSLKSLQDETKKLLDSINLSKKPKKQLLVSLSSNNLTLSNQSKKAKKRRTRFPRNSNEDRSILDLKSNLQQNLIGGNKVTVEILDADSPDVSPRERLTKKQLTFMKETEIALEDQRRVRTAELKFRSQDFKSEHIRILSKADIFVPRPGISMTDLTNEKTRLQCLEDSAREKRRVSSEETQQRVEALGCLRQAMKIQAFFRGHIGRKRAMLLYKLRDLGESTCDWIEVRDQPNGDSWFYNKISGISQWERPEEITDLISSKNNVRRLPQLPEKIKVASGRLSAVKFAAEQVLVAQQREAEEEEELHAAKEVNNILGLQYISPDDNLLAPDGYFKRPHLRETIRSALLETRFDSVSTLLADVDWVQHRRPRTTPTPSRPVDRSRRQMVSVLLPKETLRSQTSKARLNIERRKDPTASSTRDLTIREVSHPGLQKASSGPHSAANMCFGCWSAGHKKSCTLHSDGEKRKKPSETMLLCRNWELGVLRRRYRSEEIQEIFLQKAASLKYDVKRQKFMTVVEQRHPVYRMLSMLITRCNHMAALWVKTVRWANSFVEMMHSGHINTPKAVDLGQRMRDARSRQNLKGLQTFLQKVHGQLPKAPITGYSYAERNGLECLLRKHYDGFLQEEVEIMTVGPVSVPVKLYEPRIYALTPPKTIPMPHAGSTSVTANLETDGICNKVMLRKSSAAWLENLCKILTRDCTRIACSQIKSITPIADIETLRRIKEPVDSTIMFATLGRKSRHGMLDVGGLPFELLVSQLITTYFPAPYGNLVVLEKTTIGPAPTPETSITFTSLLADPVNQTYVYRPLDHILNYRKAPTISIITSSKLADEKYLCGFNRPEQTGETGKRGFRTSALSTALQVPTTTLPQTFEPANTIASLNSPMANKAITTKVDGLYPFCEPSTRDNSTLDFYHLLLESTSSPSMSQVFTATCKQDPGEFLIDMRSDLPMGQLKISVNRYTASMQRDVYEECKGDDGIPYWFHRASGKTYWERPLLGDEESNALIVTAKGEESEKQLRIKEPMASPCGFYNVISAKHVATQFADYLPQAPNLPHTHIIGRVKPKSAVADWLTLGFDPWSAGKAPLSVQFVSNLATQAGKAFPREEAQERKVDVPLLLENPSADGYIRLGDKPGGDRARAVTSKAAVLAADFKKICSMARHGKFEEVENLMNQSDWELSINYADDQGRTLLHIVSQNGNKRLVKLCLRRGAAINSQTLTGQTSLHYAFGFGFVALGEYLISKGADDSLRNSSGLTCYEGLETKHLTYL